MKISLDLLPQNKKAELKRNKIFREILREEILFLFPIFVLIVILFNVYYLLMIQKNIDIISTQIEQSQNQYQELNKYDKDFKKINEVTDFLIRTQNGHLRWANVLSHLGKAIPEGVVVDSLSTKNYGIFLIGKARTREVLLGFKHNLEEDRCFENINIPLSDLVVRENLDFQIDFDANLECLKNNQ